MFLRSSQIRTVGKFTSVASVTFSGSQSIKRKWKGDLQKYLGDDISGSAPTTQRGQEEEHSCNRDHPNWYLRHLINDSINIISTSQMLEAPATTAPTADGIESLPGSRPTRQAEQKICWNYSTNIITTSPRSDQLVTPKHHQRQYQPASSNHYNPNPTHKNNTHPGHTWHSGSIGTI